MRISDYNNLSLNSYLNPSVSPQSSNVNSTNNGSKDLTVSKPVPKVDLFSLQPSKNAVIYKNISTAKAASISVPTSKSEALEDFSLPKTGNSSVISNEVSISNVSSRVNSSKPVEANDIAVNNKIVISDEDMDRFLRNAFQVFNAEM